MNYLKVILVTTATIVFLFAFVVISCKKSESNNPPDRCIGVSCLYGGYCEFGVCKCLGPREGKACELLSRDLMLGVYRGTFTTGSTQEPETITVTADLDSYYVNLVRSSGTSTSVLITNPGQFRDTISDPYLPISFSGGTRNDSLFIEWHGAIFTPATYFVGRR